MQKSSKLIDVFVGEANDGHAELMAASLREVGIVNRLCRGIDGAETLALVHGAWRVCNDVTRVPSVILLDWGLPDEGGAGVLRVLKRDRRYRSIPAIMMTAAYNPQQAEQCRRLGCVAYMTKWTVFLGLPGFVNRLRFLAARGSWIASHRQSAGGSRRCVADSLDLRSLSTPSGTFRPRRGSLGKEVTDESSTP